MHEADRPFGLFLFTEPLEHCPRPVCIFIRHDPPAQQDPDWQQLGPEWRAVNAVQAGMRLAARNNETRMAHVRCDIDLILS